MLDKRLIENIKKVFVGISIGVINGLFGAGGGMIAVPLLKRSGLDQNSAHRNAIAVILPLTVLSAFLYLSKGFVNIKDSLVFMPTGLIGAFIGSRILSKISPKILKGIFGGFMIYAGINLLKS
ncbi:MAG: sulfite exporter TauE/SafE family protein [Clostridia bacterium]|nr:sulfite exporter TauE/SafE family protein [Clostridia bacterium]